MDIEALNIVAQVARQGSFAAVARMLDIDPSSVSRTVAAVEADLGVRLFQRSTRALSTTEEGSLYLLQISPLLEELERANNAVRAVSHKPAGVLKMTTSVAFANRCVVPHLGAFSAQYPDVEIELLASDRNIDLVTEGIDLAIRLAPAPTGDLISTRLRTTRYLVCASPDYVVAHEAVKLPADLQNHDCLRFDLPGYRTRWIFKMGDAAPEEVPVSGKFVISNALSLMDAAIAGLGPALLPDWLVQRDLSNGALIQLLPDYAVAAAGFDTAAWALYPSRSYLPQKTRVMIDFLRATLAS